MSSYFSITPGPDPEILQKLLNRQNYMAILSDIPTGISLARDFSDYFSVVCMYDKELENNDPLISGLTAKAIRLGRLKITQSIQSIQDAILYIVHSDLRLNSGRRIDFGKIEHQTHMLGNIIQPGNFVIYDICAHPGVIDQRFIPMLEQHSGMKVNKDFFVGFTHNLIQPLEYEVKTHLLSKIVGGSMDKAAQLMADIYDVISHHEVIATPSVKLAELTALIYEMRFILLKSLSDDISNISEKLDMETLEVFQMGFDEWKGNIHSLLLQPYKPEHEKSLHSFRLLNKSLSLDSKLVNRLGES